MWSWDHAWLLPSALERVAFDSSARRQGPIVYDGLEHLVLSQEKGDRRPLGSPRCSVVAFADQVPMEGRRFRSAELTGSIPVVGSCP